MSESYDKRCTKCGEIKPITLFYRKSSSPDGYRPWCKACVALWAKADRAANPEKHYLLNKSWQDANRDKVNAKAQRYKDRHREELRERDRQRYHATLKHSDAYRARRSQKCREWLKKNPLRARELHVRHKHKIAHLPRVDYDAILLRDGYICHICGADVDPVDLSFDHVVPFCLGGSHTEDNIKVSHLRCNAAKGKKLLSPVTVDPPV